MQRRLEDGKRHRVTVSLDPAEYEWIQSFENSPSESYTVSRILKAARVAGLTIDDAMSEGVLEELVDWLPNQKTKFAKDLHKVLSEFLRKR
jgi:hypothetical protein